MHSFEVENLVKVRTRQEFEIVKSLYDLNLGVIEDRRERVQYEKLLAKAGLRIADGSIVIENMDRWNQVSVCHRIEAWSKPTTTYCEESANGHVNENTHRRNPFWHPMFLIAVMTHHKTQSFRTHALHNFHNTIKRSKRMARKVPKSLMRSKCEYFWTSPEQNPSISLHVAHREQ
jgi:hypothetical protein